MKRAVITMIVVIAGLASVIALGCLGYQHFVTDQIRDGGTGMENPFIEQTKIQPAEGANLVYCSLTSSGEMAQDNYNYTLELVEGEVLLSADYIPMDKPHTVIEGQAVEARSLTKLNALVLSMDLTETHYREEPSEPFLLDGGKKRYTLRWDDGTTATPDEGFDAIKTYFETEILSQVEIQGG